jgi:hypothetical protein
MAAEELHARLAMLPMLEPLVVATANSSEACPVAVDGEECAVLSSGEGCEIVTSGKGDPTRSSGARQVA